MTISTVICVAISFCCSDLQLEIARHHTLRNDYEQSEEVLKNLSPSAGGRSMYHAYRLINNFRLNKRPEAMNQLAKLEDAFDSTLPRRYEVLVDMIKTDMQDWKTGDMHDIARDMTNVRDRLDHAKGGQKTQKIQAEVLAKLDKLIKEEQDKKDQQAKSEEQKKEGRPDEAQPKPGEAESSAPRPAQDSKIMENNGKGAIDEKKMRKYAETWGSLPAAERKRVVADVTRDLPPKFKPIIEEYFRALNKMHPR